MRTHLLILAVFVLSAHSARASSPSFTLGPASPTLGAIVAGPADVLVPAQAPAPGPLPPPVVGISAAALGLIAGDVVSGLSYGTLPAAPGPGVKIYFSVDPASTGVPFAPPPANVSCEAAGEAYGDVFVSQSLGPPLPFPNVLALDGDGVAGSPCGAPALPGLGLLEPTPDDITALALCPATGAAFAGASFTLAPGSPTLGLIGATGADILFNVAFATPYIGISAALLGLVPGDVIDAFDFSGAGGTIFSLAPGSPSLGACGFTAADIIVLGSGGGCAISLAGSALGLAPGDNIDAFAFTFDADGDLVPDNCAIVRP